MEKNRVYGKIVISNWIITSLEQISWKNWAIYCVVLSFAGALIDNVTGHTFPHFFIHQFLLIIATTLLLYALKSFFYELKLFGGEHGDLFAKNPELLSLYKNRFIPLQRSRIVLLIALFVTGFFFTCIILLDYIKLDLVGIYAIYIAGSSVLIGVYAYVQYLFFLWFIYKLGNCEHYEYDMYTPAKSPWIVQLAKTSQRLRNFFLFVGLIYVIEYGILIPRNKITITNTTINIDTANNAAFIISWIALFLLIIIAFPIINLIQRKLITRLIINLKMNSINELTQLMYAKKHYSKQKKSHLTTIVTYNILIENIRNSIDYPIKRQMSYEAAMLIITFTVHLCNLWDKIATIIQWDMLLH